MQNKIHQHLQNVNKETKMFGYESLENKTPLHRKLDISYEEFEDTKGGNPNIEEGQTTQ